ncbi:hypothetical protein [Hymenobacter terricola]|uniref:hypothetical protein n=1 Tax=Hymenobacter terricola TaxID=2819236 RepID=UPI001B30E867|nr:hypothetical protein [Hymenobacter terricola]
MNTRLLTKFRIFKLTHERTPGHDTVWSFKPLVGEENHEFDSEAAAHEWVADNPEIMIRCREFIIVPVYHLVLA